MLIGTKANTLCVLTFCLEPHQTPYDFYKFGAARVGEYCGALQNGKIEPMESMDCIVFYSSLKDAVGALIVLDS